MEDEQILQENAQCFELVNNEYWNFIKDYFVNQLNLLKDVDTISVGHVGSDWETVGKEVFLRKANIAFIEDMFADIETKAQQHRDTQEALGDDRDQIIHRS